MCCVTVWADAAQAPWLRSFVQPQNSPFCPITKRLPSGGPKIPFLHWPWAAKGAARMTREKRRMVAYARRSEEAKSFRKA